MSERNEKRTMRQTRRETHHEKNDHPVIDAVSAAGPTAHGGCGLFGRYSAGQQRYRDNKTLSSGSLELRNDYLRVIVRKDGTLSTAPAADSADPTDRQMPYCNFVTFKGSGYNKRDIVHPAELRMKHIVPVDKTPNGAAEGHQGGVRHDGHGVRENRHRNDHGLL